MTSYLKSPPVLDDETNYDNFKKEVEIWILLVGGDLQKKQLGPALFKAIRPRKAKDKVLELEVKDIGAEDGITRIIQKLDEIYLLDKDQRIYIALDSFETYKRDQKMNMTEFVSEFEVKHNKIKQYDCVLPDGVLAYKLLKAANLTESQEQLCRATIGQWSYANMITQLKRIFDNVLSNNTITSNNAVTVKVEPVNWAETSGFSRNREQCDQYCYGEDRQRYYETSNHGGNDIQLDNPERTYYGRNYTHGYNQHHLNSWKSTSRFPYNNNNFNMDSRPYSSQVPVNPYHSYGQSRNQYAPRNTINSRDSRGNVTKCAYCKSIMHWVQDCPHKLNEDNSSQDGGELLNKVQSTLFQFTSTKFDEISGFLSETANLAIIDCGCTCTVIGESNYKTFIDTLSEKQKKILHEEPSSVSFKFGDNPIVQSHKRATLPVKLNGVECTLQTEVVRKDIPLLLSKSSMKKANTRIDFMKDTIEMFGRERSTVFTKSGHCGIPITSTLRIPWNSDVKYEEMEQQPKLFTDLKSTEDREKIAQNKNTTMDHPRSKRLINRIKESDNNDQVLFHKLHVKDAFTY